MPKSANESPFSRERRILKGLRRGDLEALDLAWHGYAKRVFSFFYRMTWNQSEAASLTEEAFAVLWRGAMLVPEEVPLDITLYRMARNVLVEHERELHVASQSGSIPQVTGATGSMSGRMQTIEPRTPSKRMSARKAKRAAQSEAAARDQALGVALLSLDTDAHMAFVLLVYQGLMPVQVANVLGIEEQEVLDLACVAEASARKEIRQSLSLGPVAGDSGDSKSSGNRAAS